MTLEVGNLYVTSLYLINRERGKAMKLYQYSKKAIILSALYFIFGACFANMNEMVRVTQNLVDPPYLPEHSQIATGSPKIVEIKMVI